MTRYCWKSDGKVCFEIATTRIDGALSNETIQERIDVDVVND